MRVRFAPSPTGHLHIGGARTALYGYLIARAQKGALILRIEDTDLKRSKTKFKKSIINDLLWIGINFDEGVNNVGEFAPYHQSQRLKIYQKYAHKLIEKKKSLSLLFNGTRVGKPYPKSRTRKHSSPHLS